MRTESQEVFISADFLRDASDEELKGLIEETQKRLLDLKTQAQFCPPEKSHLFRSYRRLIARAKTILRERQE